MRKNFSKEIFPIKRNSDGSIQRYKAKLVVEGFHQCLRLDYTETFNTVVKLTTDKQFYVLLSLMIGLYTSLMLIMHFFKGLCIRRFL